MQSRSPPPPPPLPLPSPIIHFLFFFARLLLKEDAEQDGSRKGVFLCSVTCFSHALKLHTGRSSEKPQVETYLELKWDCQPRRLPPLSPCCRRRPIVLLVVLNRRFLVSRLGEQTNWWRSFWDRAKTNLFLSTSTLFCGIVTDQSTVACFSWTERVQIFTTWGQRWDCPSVLNILVGQRDWNVGSSVQIWRRRKLPATFSGFRSCLPAGESFCRSAIFFGQSILEFAR